MGSLTCGGRRMDGTHQNSLGSVPLGCPSGPILLEGRNLNTASYSRPCLSNSPVTVLQCRCRHAPAPLTISFGYMFACSTPLPCGFSLALRNVRGDPPAEQRNPVLCCSTITATGNLCLIWVGKEPEKGLMHDAGSDGRSCYSSSSFQR